ncbi:MAG: DUF4214 domain-containing protein [Acidithiobacillus sp.]|nr:DUF4214 domain-containing protein [Acidithiobacillus sp.]
MRGCKTGFPALWDHWWPGAEAREADLRALPDAEFVEAIYQRYLGRAADEEGKAYYLRLLRAGRGRVRVLKDFRRSAEARRYTQYRQRRLAIADFLRKEHPPPAANGVVPSAASKTSNRTARHLSCREFAAGGPGVGLVHAALPHGFGLAGGGSADSCRRL